MFLISGIDDSGRPVVDNSQQASAGVLPQVSAHFGVDSGDSNVPEPAIFAAVGAKYSGTSYSLLFI